MVDRGSRLRLLPSVTSTKERRHRASGHGNHTSDRSTAVALRVSQAVYRSVVVAVPYYPLTLSVDGEDPQHPNPSCELEEAFGEQKKVLRLDCRVRLKTTVLD